MYLILTDETNRNTETSTFFLVGGIAVPAEIVNTLHSEVEAIRARNGYRPGDSFKYARADKPARVSEEQFNAAKAEGLDLVVTYGVVILVYACHHLIADTRTEEEKFRWGNNALLWMVQQFLQEQTECAWVLQDRHPVGNEFKYYTQRFQDSAAAATGVTHKLTKVVGFGSTCDGASHLASLSDIALGSYRFCVNHPDKDIVNGILLPKLLRATWGYPNPLEKGFSLFPRRGVKKRECVADYDGLRAHISGFLPNHSLQATRDPRA